MLTEGMCQFGMPMTKSKDDLSKTKSLCLGYRPTREFFTHMETSPLQVKGCNFDLCLAFMAIGQRGFFGVPDLL